MATRLKSIRFTNFGGHRDTFFDFTENGRAKPLILLYGPNGYGKSTVLEGIRITSNPYIFDGRNLAPDIYLRKYVYDEDYQATTDAISGKIKNPMRVEALYETSQGDARVHLTNDGFELNELTKLHGGHAFYMDSDNPANWAKFQMIADDAPKFVELAEAIYGHDCDLDAEVKDSIVEPDGSVSEHLFYQDFILQKGPTKVHYARMSAGEKKLATALRQLCTPDNVIDKHTGQKRGIVLLDNIEMHVYMKRHAKLLDKILEVFGDHQIIATTHSPILVGTGDIPPHVDPKYLFDLEQIVTKEMQYA
jgi:predicted ATP-binding protein involved in virulence